MDANFDKALARVLMEEGGYSNNPKDPGGATMKGIIQRVYDGWRDRQNLPRQPVKAISDAEVRAIYKAQYWDLAKCDQLPVGVDYVVFDGDVNSGVAQSVKWLQRTLGVAVDGQIGPTTIAAANAYGDPGALIDGICDKRLAFLKALKTWSTFGKGWGARVSRVRAAGKAMAASAPDAPVGLLTLPGNAKADIADAKPAPVLGAADGSTGAGVAGGGLAGYISSAKDQLSGFAGVHFVDNMLLYLTIGSIVLVAGGAGYRWYAQRKRTQRAEALDLPTSPTTQPAAAQ